MHQQLWILQHVLLHQLVVLVHHILHRYPATLLYVLAKSRIEQDTRRQLLALQLLHHLFDSLLYVDVILDALGQQCVLLSFLEPLVPLFLREGGVAGELGDSVSEVLLYLFAFVVESLVQVVYSCEPLYFL